VPWSAGVRLHEEVPVVTPRSTTVPFLGLEERSASLAFIEGWNYEEKDRLRKGASDRP